MPEMQLFASVEAAAQEAKMQEMPVRILSALAEGRLLVAATAFVSFGTVRRVPAAMHGSTVTAQRLSHAFRVAM
ncbi:MAG: hypothetical protein V1738_02080 [Patescibacteria group bacterium]